MAQRAEKLKALMSVLLLVSCVTILTGWCAYTFMGRGWLFPVRVGSASMAPAFCGPSRRVECPDCGFSFLIGQDVSATETELVCPNCGQVGTVGTGHEVRPGQRVLIERFPAEQKVPRRFDVVIAESDVSSELITKRVVGLPGESVRTAHGDVLVDDQVVCKTSHQYVESAIVVHQDIFRPRSQSFVSRWRPGVALSGWSPTETGHQWKPPAGNSNTENDWLTYYHSAALPPPHQRGADSVMLDNCPFNQSTSRALNRVSDNAIVLTARWAGNGTISFRRDAVDQSWLVVFETATRQAQLFHISAESERKLLTESRPTGWPVPTAEMPSANSYSVEQSFLFGYWDGQFQFVNNGQHLISFAAAVQSQLSASKRPFAIAASQLGDLQLRNLLVSRDVFYTDAYGTSQPWSFGRRLESDEYLTLGDNSPVSRDSRQAPELGVFRRDQLIGKARIWFE